MQGLALTYDRRTRPVRWTCQTRLKKKPADMKFVERTLDHSSVRSLVWQGDVLIDWVAGGTRFFLDGSKTEARVYFAGDFDAAIATGCGDIAVIYRRLGTKAIVLKNGQFVREINRSFYHAHVYEYPICLWERKDSPAVIIHCPNDYNRLEMEEAVSGRRLFDGETRNPPDIFHSRLSVNPSGTYLLSAGWVWHPVDVANIYRLPTSNGDIDFDTPFASVDAECDVSACSWINDELVLAANADSGSNQTVEQFANGTLGCWSTKSMKWTRLTMPNTTLGQLMPLGEDHVVSFYEHPKLLRLSDGAVVNEWPHIPSGKQTSSIIHHHESLPTIAADRAGLRFAVASDRHIHVVSFEAE